MIIELIILAGLFLVFIGTVMLAVINWLEARELKKQSERLSRYRREGFNGKI
tara:strand:+ start:504 stop:659 length:156 start_codon:yes stop_codon:yes gene_type:complete